MEKKKYDIEDRLVDFAAMIVLFCKDLPNDLTGQYYGHQLLRSAGSSALNYGEYQGANTIRDQINKLTISLKELKESRMSLRILGKIKYSNPIKIVGLLNEVEQLIKIISTIVKNKKSE